MSMYYSMILIPDDPYLRPDPERIVSFLGGLLEMGALGKPDRIAVGDWAKTKLARVGRNPITGERVEIWLPEMIKMKSVQDLPQDLEGLTEFDVVIEGTGPARVFPIREIHGCVDGQWRLLEELLVSGANTKFVGLAPGSLNESVRDNYFLRVECCQRSKLTSTSDLHEETQTDRTAEPFGKPCDLGDRVGLYSNPETIELITVPNSGCSTFWIAFQLGSWLFPSFAEKKINFAEPSVMRLAETAFRTKFAEGCSWG
jgi:hypothetical protein